MTTSEQARADASDVLSRFRRDVATARIIGEGNLEESRLFVVGALMRLGRNDLIPELATLQAHACDWSEDDYCNTCGADGRA